MCKWSNDKYADYWSTECGKNSVDSRPPSERGFRYCPYCGDPIIEVSIINGEPTETALAEIFDITAEELARTLKKKRSTAIKYANQLEPLGLSRKLGNEWLFSRNAVDYLRSLPERRGRKKVEKK